MIERWLPVVGWEGRYEVSDLGRVRSIPRQTRTGLLGGGILKLKTNRFGYKVAHLRDSGREAYLMAHRMVLTAFVGPPADGLEACHFPDRDPSNNRLNNLRWDTNAANKADAIRHGTHPCFKRKFDHEEMKRRYRDGATIANIASRIGASRQHVRFVVKGYAEARLARYFLQA